MPYNSVHAIPSSARAWQALLATSQDAIQLKKRGFKMRFDDVLCNTCQALLTGPYRGYTYVVYNTNVTVGWCSLTTS